MTEASIKTHDDNIAHEEIYAVIDMLLDTLEKAIGDMPGDKASSVALSALGQVAGRMLATTSKHNSNSLFVYNTYVEQIYYGVLAKTKEPSTKEPIHN